MPTYGKTWIQNQARLISIWSHPLKVVVVICMVVGFIVVLAVMIVVVVVVFVVVVIMVGLRNLTFKFGKNRVSNSLDNFVCFVFVFVVVEFCR